MGAGLSRKGKRFHLSLVVISAKMLPRIPECERIRVNKILRVKD